MVQNNSNLAFVANEQEQSPLELMLSLNSVNGLQALSMAESQNGFIVKASVQFPQDYRWHNIAHEFDSAERVKSVCLALINAHVAIHDDEEEMSGWVDAVSDTASYSRGFVLNSDMA